MSTTRHAYFCYTCSEEVTFHGTRVRYNLDGSLHLCKPDDKVAYEKYCEYIRRDKTGWRLTGEDFWKWKREIYDVQRWTQSRDYYNELKEQQQRAAEADAKERRKAAEAEAQHRKAAEEAEAQRREEQRKQAARGKRRAARERRKQREQAEAEAAAREAKAHRRRRRRSSRSRSPESHPRQGGMLEQALKIMGLTVDILRLSTEEAVTEIKNRFRTLAMKFHPDRG